MWETKGRKNQKRVRGTKTDTENGRRSSSSGAARSVSHLLLPHQVFASNQASLLCCPHLKLEVHAGVVKVLQSVFVILYPIEVMVLEGAMICVWHNCMNANWSKGI
jgi:hypothetical protein